MADDDGDRDTKPRWGEVEQLWNLVYFVLAVIGLVITLILWLVQPDLIRSWIGSTPIALIEFAIRLLVSSGLMIAWWIVARQERDFLKEVGEDLIPRVPKYSALLVVLSTIALVAFIPASVSAASFGFVYVVIKTLESWNAWVAETAIRDGIRTRLDDPSQPTKRKDQARLVDRYYFGNPWRQIGDSGMLVSAAATILAIAAPSFPDVSLRDASLGVSTFVLAAAIVVHEFVATQWRHRRDAERKEIDSGS